MKHNLYWQNFKYSDIVYPVQSCKNFRFIRQQHIIENIFDQMKINTLYIKKLY